MTKLNKGQQILKKLTSLVLSSNGESASFLLTRDQYGVAKKTFLNSQSIMSYDLDKLVKKNNKKDDEIVNYFRQALDIKGTDFAKKSKVKFFKSGFGVNFNISYQGSETNRERKELVIVQASKK